MFFLFGVKGAFLFLITKKEKYPLKLRCSQNNKTALGQACLKNRLKPKWFYKALNKALSQCRLCRQKGTLNPSRFKKALNPKRPQLAGFAGKMSLVPCMRGGA
jgi:hypothetical protein